MGYDASSEESVDAMAGAVEKLVGDHKVERLVLFFKRADFAETETMRSTPSCLKP